MRVAARGYRVTTPRNGKPRGRPTLLYVRYRDMRSRAHGRGTRSPEIYAGKGFGFRNFHEFREFAIARGFSKQFSSPDRANTAYGYFPWNIVFRDPLTNMCAGLANGRRIKAQGLALSRPSRRNVTGVIDWDSVPF